ncbi:Rha family transcriptional regulator [Leucobacter sp. G161]|uniref:Rha family transcriptional regulator n=1 Tax=Leucobacter sp. G161 TaxID=663704 RepID=UPI00073B178E|nr:Rha family transcriptional regulator [Leucobacter sp. G161]KUF06862.1 hypothetical protein AUL38_10775 [Leucobacter sp. G161]
MSEVQTINIIEDADGELRVSSLIIAGRTENQHASVMRIVRDRQAELEEFGLVGFEIAPRMSGQHGGGDTMYALLNEPQSTLLMTFMRNSPVVVEFKVELVKQFFAMRQALAVPQHALPQTYSEALRELAATAEKNTELAQKIIDDEPKVDYVETFVADEDLRILRNVAKSLGMGEEELRTDLMARNWIYQEKSTRWSEKEQRKVPHNRYSAYSGKTNYFIPVPTHDAPRFKGEVMHTLKVTPAGAVAIARLYGRHLAAVEAVSA